MKPIKFLQRRKQVSFNYAKFTSEQLENLRGRYTLIEKRRNELKDDLSALKLLESEFEFHKQELLILLNLRKKKGYNFNLLHGYVHRPNMKPWENGALKKKEIPDFPMSENVNA